MASRTETSNSAALAAFGNAQLLFGLLHVRLERSQLLPVFLGRHRTGAAALVAYALHVVLAGIVDGILERLLRGRELVARRLCRGTAALGGRGEAGVRGRGAGTRPG